MHVWPVATSHDTDEAALSNSVGRCGRRDREGSHECETVDRLTNRELRSETVTTWPLAQRFARLGMVLVLTGLATFTAAASDVLAQPVIGVLVKGETGESVEGAMIILLDQAGDVVDRALTDLRGGFSLDADSPGIHSLAIERIGIASTTHGPFHVGPEGVIRRVSAVEEAIELAGIEVTGEHRCVVRPDVGRTTALVWDEARKALAAGPVDARQRHISLYGTQLPPGDGLARARDPRRKPKLRAIIRGYALRVASRRRSRIKGLRSARWRGRDHVLCPRCWCLPFRCLPRHPLLRPSEWGGRENRPHLRARARARSARYQGRNVDRTVRRRSPAAGVPVREP